MLFSVQRIESVMKKILLCFSFLLFLSCEARAQAPVVQPPVTAVRFTITGGVSPVTNDIPLSAFTSTTTCFNTSGTVHNPLAFQYKVNNTDSNCWQYTDPGNGPLLSLPIGGTTYVSTASYINGNGSGPLSANSNPFDKPGVAPTTAPVTLRVGP